MIYKSELIVDIIRLLDYWLDQCREQYGHNVTDREWSDCSRMKRRIGMWNKDLLALYRDYLLQLPPGGDILRTRPQLYKYQMQYAVKGQANMHFGAWVLGKIWLTHKSLGYSIPVVRTVEYADDTLTNLKADNTWWLHILDKNFELYEIVNFTQAIITQFRLEGKEPEALLPQLRTHLERCLMYINTKFPDDSQRHMADAKLLHSLITGRIEYSPALQRKERSGKSENLKGLRIYTPADIEERDRQELISLMTEYDKAVA